MDAPTDILHLELLILNFFDGTRQDRYLNLIRTKKGRLKFRKYIAHFKDLNPKCINDVSYLKSSSELFNLLRQYNAPDECYVISENSNYDNQFFDLSYILDTLFNSGIAFFVSSIPGKLVYYEGEEVNQKKLLKS